VAFQLKATFKASTSAQSTKANATSADIFFELRGCCFRKK